MKKINILILLGTLSLLLFACNKKVTNKIINISVDSKTIEFIKNSDRTIVDKLWDDDEESIAAIERHRGNCEGNTYTLPDTKYEVKKINIASMDVLTMKKEADYEKIFFYIHGGGFIAGIDPMHIQYVDKIVDSCDVKAYMPLYKLIPEYTCNDTYPVLVEVYKELLKENKDIIISGDSAGGNIALAFVQYLKELNLKLPSKMVLHSPGVDLTLSEKDIDKYKETEVNLPKTWVRHLGKYWAGNKKVTDYLVNPLYGDMNNLPKTMIFACTGEILYPGIYKAYEKMVDCGVDVTLVSIEKGVHVISEELGLKEGQESLKLAIDFINND